MITKETWQTLADAVARPDDYTSGKRRKILQAAVDFALNAVSKKFANRDMTGWMNLRQDLNALDDSKLSEEDRALVVASREILRNREMLHSKRYEDHKDNVGLFCKKVLPGFWNSLTYEK